MEGKGSDYNAIIPLGLFYKCDCTNESSMILITILPKIT